MQIPALIALPRGLLKLMLHVEQPYAGRGGEQHDRKMHEQERLDADQPGEPGGDQGNGEIGYHGAGPRLPAVAHEADGETVLQEKQIGWSEHEHDQWVTVKSVFQTAPPRTGLVFAHCQGIDVANTAPVKVAGGGMMDRMRAAPPVVRRQRQHANDAADPVVCQTISEKGAMAAVVLDQEQAQEKAGSRNRDQQRNPSIAKGEREPSSRP